MTLAVILSIPVFYDVFSTGMSTKIMVITIILISMFYLLTLNNLIKRVVLDKTSISTRSILGVKHILLEDIDLVDGATMGTRQFITISSKKKNYLAANSLDGFSDLISRVIEMTDKEIQGEGLHIIAENTINRKSEATGAWITVILLLIIIVIRFFAI